MADVVARWVKMKLRELYSVVSQILWELFPYKNLNYFADYFQTVRLVTEKHDRVKCFLVKTVICYQLLECVRYFYLYVFQFELIERVVWYDVIHLFGLKNSGNLMAGGVHAMVGYYYYLLYYQGNTPTNHLLESVLINEKTDFFPQPYCRDKPIYRVVQRITLFIFNILQMFIFALDFFMVTSCFLMLSYIRKYWDYFNNFYHGGYFKIMLFQFNIMFFNVGLIIFAHSCIIVATLFFVSTKVIFIKLNQLTNLVESQTMNDKINFYLPRYIRDHTRTLVLIQSSNGFYGKAFLIYLVVNFPFNVFLVMSIILMRDLPPVKLFFVYIMALQQIIFIFGIHLMCALYSLKMHQNSRHLIHLNLYAPHQSFETKLKLNHYIDKYHTKKCYGITYGKFGLITFRAFVKYLMLYAKFLMITYKILIKG